VESRNHGEVSGFVGIKLLPHPKNLPLESLSLRLSCFKLMLVFLFNSYSYFPSNVAKMFSQFKVSKLSIINCQPRKVDS